MSAALVVTEREIDLLLAEAAISRASFLDGNLLVPDEASIRKAIDDANLIDALAEKLAPFCVPPLTEFERECASCESGMRLGSACRACLGTGVLPPTRDGKRVVL